MLYGGSRLVQVGVECASTTCLSMSNATNSLDELKSANRARFELELEFVQALANPYYLHSLAQQNFLEQPAFINYLAYLQYFREKDYARFIQ
jgi:mediator of RNA polymerase II transcription subunit 31